LTRSTPPSTGDWSSPRTRLKIVRSTCWDPCSNNPSWTTQRMVIFWCARRLSAPSFANLNITPIITKPECAFIYSWVLAKDLLVFCGSPVKRGIDWSSRPPRAGKCKLPIATPIASLKPSSASVSLLLVVTECG
jgi:hypothetical protein